MRVTISYEEDTVMYIGSKNREGWKACIREIFQNAIDEMIRFWCCDGSFKRVRYLFLRAG